MGYLNTVEPTLIDPERWWAYPKIKSPVDLRPQPEADILLIVGDAHCVLDDLERFIEMVPARFDTMCINYSVKIVPWKIQHFIAGDSHMPDMQAVAATLPPDVIRHCWNPNSTGFNVRWHRISHTGWNGTTANLGLKIGVALGYLKIVLAGCPMDGGGNWYRDCLPETDRKRGKDHRAHLWKWTEIAARPISRLCRSMSGNTRDLLGEPTTQWLEET
jgi:hypothetical protein